eukprot:scaffold27350_cov69-Phaeocystis_antarctica.AAC.2
MAAAQSPRPARVPRTASSLYSSLSYPSPILSYPNPNAARGSRPVACGKPSESPPADLCTNPHLTLLY